MMREILTSLSAALPDPRVIFDREGGSPYLSRWYLIGKRPVLDPELPGQQFADQVAVAKREHRLPFNLFLHRFHRSDDDGALHSHPWAWSLSLVLVGGYSEERRQGDSVVRRLIRPGMFNFIRGTDYHRVDLLEYDTWSLFLVGPKASTWYFWDRYTGKRSPWRDFIAFKRGLSNDARWEPDYREAAE